MYPSSPKNRGRAYAQFYYSRFCMFMQAFRPNWAGNDWVGDEMVMATMTAHDRKLNKYKTEETANTAAWHLRMKSDEWQASRRSIVSCGQCSAFHIIIGIPAGKLYEDVRLSK